MKRDRKITVYVDEEVGKAFEVESIRMYAKTWTDLLREYIHSVVRHEDPPQPPSWRIVATRKDNSIAVIYEEDGWIDHVTYNMGDGREYIYWLKLQGRKGRRTPEEMVQFFRERDEWIDVQFYSNPA